MGLRLLDLGCGDGTHAAFAQSCGARVLAMDMDAAVLRQQSPAQRVTADICHVPLVDGCMDRVVLTEVLEHVADPNKVMAEAVRVAAPGARFLLSVPSEAAEKLQQRLAPPAYFEPPGHIRIFAPGQLEGLATAHGLVVERRLAGSLYWSVWWALFWTCDCELAQPRHRLLRRWDQTWELVLRARDGDRIRAAFSEICPKSEALVCLKPP